MDIKIKRTNTKGEITEGRLTIDGRHDGSILVGTRSCLGCIIHPKPAFDSLYERIRKNLERGREVTLVIEECP